MNSGNLKKPEYFEDEENLFLSEIRDPLIDIFESEDLVYVLAELPEIKRKISCLMRLLKISSQGNWSFGIFTVIEFPVRVDPNSKKLAIKMGA